MTKGKISMGLALAATLAALVPATAQARDHYRGYDDRGRYERSYRGYDRRDDRRYYEGRRYDDRRVSYRCGKSSGTTGLLLGGVAGALLGRSVDRYGDRTPGTIIGAGAGALLGKELDSNRRC